MANPSPRNSRASNGSATEPLMVPAGFEALKLLDESALGLRVRARRLADGRLVRLMLPAPEALALPGFAAALDARVRAAGPVRHPALVAVLQYAASDRYLVSSDTPEHQSVAALIANRGLMQPALALSIARQVAVVQDEAARQGVHHGWLRADAVLVDAGGRVLVDDLALAKPLRWLADRTRANDVLAIAPERLDGTNPDRSGDIFALGALLLRMFTGLGPYGEGAKADAMARYMRAPAVSDHRADLPRGIDLLVRRMLDPDPGIRPTTWPEAIEDLDAVAAGREPGSARTTRPRRVATPEPALVPTPQPMRPVPAGGGQRRRKQGSNGLVIAVVVGVAVVAAVVIGIAASGPSKPAQQAADQAPAPTQAVDAGRSADIQAMFDKKKAEEEERKNANLRRLQLVKEIDTLVMAEKYQAATELAAKLDRDFRSNAETSIRTSRERRRTEIEEGVRQAASEADAEQLLNGPLNVWGLPGDQEWAKGLLAQTRERLAAEAEARRKAAGPVLPVLPAVPWRALDRADLAADRALLAGKKPAADPALSPEQRRALATKQAHWERRDRLIAKVLAAKIKLRVNHPTTRELCDVAKADGRFLDLAAPNGSTSSVPWSALPPASLAKLFADCTAAPGLSADDSAVAAAAMLVAGDSALARATLRRAKDIAAEPRADLELMAGAVLRRPLGQRIDAAEAALAANAAGPIEALGAELAKSDWKEVPGTAEDLAWLEAALATVRIRAAAAAAAAPAADAKP